MIKLSDVKVRAQYRTRVRYSLVPGPHACAFAALCYAEFASMVPVAGSAYTYAYATPAEKLAALHPPQRAE